MRRTKFLTEQVVLAPHFQRSIRIDIDLNKEDVLNGYVLQPTAKSALENLARSLQHSKQSAFTWTGPYGGGKSSLALLLSSLVSPTKKLREHAKKILGIDDSSEIVKAFSQKWRFLPITGSRESVSDLIYSAADQFLEDFRKPGRRSKDVIGVLEEYAKAKRCKILLVIDEMGKVLEHMAKAGEDIFFFQDLAERTREYRNIVTIGILHQSFEQYAQRLSKELRDEWAKVQGRYVDLPLSSTNDETINLVSRAIHANYAHPQSARYAETVFKAIKVRRPNISDEIKRNLDQCWPLHPAVAVVLGPASRKRYGQNERSLFAFLSSVEAGGLRSFLEQTKASESANYGPAEYFDYLNINLSAAIQGSGDSRLWALISDALERANRLSSNHQRLLKSIAVIELFKDSSGLQATTDVLETLEISSSSELEGLLQSLAKNSIIVYRKHIGAWALYAGSDFDIESAIDEAKAEIGELSTELLAKLIDPAPVIAKEHYWKSGCLRWFTKQILSITALKQRKGIRLDEGSGGAFILVLPDEISGINKLPEILQGESRLISEDSNYQHVGIILGSTSAELSTSILQAAQESAALDLILRTRSELESDQVARQEIRGRIETAEIVLETQLEAAMLQASWTYAGGAHHEFDRKAGLGIIASYVASNIYKYCPEFHNELLNRQSLSSSAAKARKDLLYQMLASEHKEHLGYTGSSPDAGLYGSILRDRIHSRYGETWRFVCDSSKADNLGKLWRETEALLNDSEDGISLPKIYKFWEGKPFGLRRGISPVLFFAFYLANREKYAIYSQSVFIPTLTDIHIDEFLKSPDEFLVREVRLTADQEALLRNLSHSLAKTQRSLFEISPLEIARGLVARILRLPSWTRRTAKLNPDTRRIRASLLAANDPNALLFHELPKVLGTTDSAYILSELTKAIEELELALPKQLQSVMDAMLSALGEKHSDLKLLNQRATAIKGQSGDPEMDGFLVRLSDFANSTEQSLDMVSIAAKKQARDLTDLDFQTAENQLLTWCLEFRKLELLATVNSRSKGKYVLNFGYGLHNAQQMGILQFQVSDESRRQAEAHAKKIKKLLESLDRETQLAALAHTSHMIAEENNG
jgi:hypothetical protein